MHTHNHTLTCRFTHTDPWRFFFMGLWSQRYPDASVLSRSCFSSFSFISPHLSFAFIFNCLFDMCTSYHHPPSSCFSFPLLYIAVIFFQMFAVGLFNPSTTLLSTVSDMEWPIHAAYSLFFHTEMWKSLALLFLKFQHQKHKILHIVIHKNSKVFCEDEATFTHLGGARDGNLAKRNWRHGCRRWE